jgi:hypothetical protein
VSGADPDPHQNVMDPEHWVPGNFLRPVAVTLVFSTSMGG